MGHFTHFKSTRRFAEVAHAPCVYAAELSNGVIKVGAASSARGRLIALAAEARREHAAELGRFHVVVKRTPKAAYEAETRIVKRLEEVAQPLPGRREWFTGIVFEDAVNLISACESAWQASTAYVVSPAGITHAAVQVRNLP